MSSGLLALACIWPPCRERPHPRKPGVATMWTRSPQGCPTGGVEQSGSCSGASGHSWSDYVQLKVDRQQILRPRCLIPPEVLEPVWRQPCRPRCCRPGESGRGERRPALADEDRVTPGFRRGAGAASHSSPWMGVGARGAVRTCSTAPLKSTWPRHQEVADLGRPQPVPEGQQDHGGVAVAVPFAPGGLDQRLDLADG